MILLALATSCTQYIGFPPIGRDPFAHPDEYFIDDGGMCDFDEREPNDLDGDYDLDSLTAFGPGQKSTVCGRVSTSGTTSDGHYSGDFDYFMFTSLAGGTVELVLDWRSDANLDLHAGDSEADTWWSSNANDEPESITFDCYPDRYYMFLVVGQKGSDVQYTTQISVY